MWGISVSSDVIVWWEVLQTGSTERRNQQVFQIRDTALVSFSVQTLRTTALLLWDLVCRAFFVLRWDRLKVCMWENVSSHWQSEWFPSFTQEREREKLLDPEWKNTEEKSPPNNTHRCRKTEIALTNVTHLKINPEAQLQPWCSKATQPILKRCFVLGVHRTARHPPCGVTTGMLRSCLVGQVSHWSPWSLGEDFYQTTEQ